MPHYFYPLMDIGYPDKSHECIRLGAIGVIAHLLKAVHIHILKHILIRSHTNAFEYPLDYFKNISLNSLCSLEKELLFVSLWTQVLYVFALEPLRLALQIQKQ